jgi:DNA polymerase V
MKTEQPTGVSIHSGFPNAGTDASLTSLDLPKLLVEHPSSTFFMRLSGGEWETEGIFDGDIIVVDRAVEPKQSDLIIWWDRDSFAISKLSKLPEATGWWGIVTFIIHRTKK